MKTSKPTKASKKGSNINHNTTRSRTVAPGKASNQKGYILPKELAKFVQQTSESTGLTPESVIEIALIVRFGAKHLDVKSSGKELKFEPTAQNGRILDAVEKAGFDVSDFINSTFRLAMNNTKFRADHGLPQAA